MRPASSSTGCGLSVRAAPLVPSVTAKSPDAAPVPMLASAPSLDASTTCVRSPRPSSAAIAGRIDARAVVGATGVESRVASIPASVSARSLHVREASANMPVAPAMPQSISHSPVQR